MLICKLEAGLIGDTLLIFGMLLAPFAAFAIIIHWLESFTQRRLAERFGWKSVLWTGWLGTPIHELSHVLMCWVFNHRIDEIALFEPDEESGRLGYVRHSFTTGNWFQETGNLFIGVAPLMGGSLALAGLMWLFYPEIAAAAIERAQSDASFWDKTIAMFAGVSGSILSFDELVKPKFWVFLYLVLCVGSHMGPSPSDYRGAKRGVWLVAGTVLAIAFLMALSGTEVQVLGQAIQKVLGPLFALFGLTILLVFLAAALVFAVTSLFKQRFVTR